MQRHDTLRFEAISKCRRAVALAVVAIAILPLDTAAQVRSARDTSTVYGARLDGKGVPANLNPNRINNRINNRVETRIALRIERYRAGNSTDPMAALAVRPTDNARIGTATTLSPISVSGSSSATKASAVSPQTPGQIEDGSQPR